MKNTLLITGIILSQLLNGQKNYLLIGIAGSIDKYRLVQYPREFAVHKLKRKLITAQA